MDQDSRLLHVTPMFHLADTTCTMAGMLARATHVFIPMFVPQATVQALSGSQITHVVMVPVMIQMVINDPSIVDADMTKLKYLLYGGAPISEAVLTQAMGALPNTQFSQGYSQTELAPLALILGPEYHTISGPKAGKLKSAGIDLPCTEVKIVGEDDKECYRGDIGEIIVRGPTAMTGYWNKPEETAVSMRNRWVYTGDARYMDEEGFVFLVDRVKDMIVSGEENVYSAEIENAVMNHPAVEQVVVIGIPSEEWGEHVHAEIILKAGHEGDEADIIAKTKEYIAKYKCPRSITFRTEPFPMSGAGKLLKRNLRAPYWEGKERQIN